MPSKFLFKTDAGYIKFESNPLFITFDINGRREVVERQDITKKKLMLEKVMLESYNIHEKSKQFIICRFESSQQTHFPSLYCYNDMDEFQKKDGENYVYDFSVFSDGDYVTYNLHNGNRKFDKVMPYKDFWKKLKNEDSWYYNYVPRHFYYRNRIFQSYIGIWICTLIENALKYVLFEEVHPKKWKVCLMK